ncbi:hypothetical protein N665_0420s0026 [Sinapis alba]|nr:hypothetical protein N665_0420s0026 [Sinapis alba]
MSEWRRIRLALIIIVDGVLIASQQVHRPTLRYVKMLENIHAFLDFPWGRESFIHTVRCMKPPMFDKGKPVHDPVGMLVQKLKQETFRLTGFPLALQLLAFRAIPMLQAKIPAPLNEYTIMDLTEPHLPNHPSIDLNEVLLVEDNPELVVVSKIPVTRGPQPGWGVWSDESVDEKIVYMEQLIRQNHRFTKSMWPGGDSSEPLYQALPVPPKPVFKKHTVPRKSKASDTVLRKRNDSSSVSAPTDQFLVDKITDLEARVVTLEATAQRLRAKLKRKCGNIKFFSIKRRRRNTPQPPLIIDQGHELHHTPPSPFPDQDHAIQHPPPIQPASQSQGDCGGGSVSPILSQHRIHDSHVNELLAGPHIGVHPILTHKSPIHPSPETLPPIHTSPFHNPFSLSSPVHQSPDHATPVHHIIAPLLPVHPSSTHPSPIHNPSSHSSPVHPTPDHETPVHHIIAPLIPVQPSPTHPSPDAATTFHTPHSQIPRSPPTIHPHNTPPPSPASDTQRSCIPTPPHPTSPDKLSPHTLDSANPPSNEPAPIATLPRFDATPLPQAPPVGSHSAKLTSPLPVYDSDSLPYSPPPLVARTIHNTTNMTRVVLQGFSHHSAIANAFSATAAIGGSSTPQASLLFDGTNDIHGGDCELSDSSPTKKIQSVVDDINVSPILPTFLDIESAINSITLDVCDLSDSSPAKKRPRHSPTELENVLAQTMMDCRTLPHYMLITSPPKDLWAIFSETLSIKRNVFHITPSTFDFTNDFLLKLATPRQWTDTLHMTVLMHMLSQRHKDILQMEKAAFSSPALISLIQSKNRQFQAAIHKDRIRWDPRLTKMILHPGQTWMKEVLTVYTPMIWADKHWVGLCINLLDGHVEVFDPLNTLYSDKAALRFLKPILHMLPYLIKYVANVQSCHLSPFTWHRSPDVYQNFRSGDCGPVSVTFMEQHLYGNPYPHMLGITDENVDHLRQLYAMEVYKTIVLPAYLPPTST